MDAFTKEVLEIKRCRTGLHYCIKTKNYEKMLKYMERLSEYSIDVNHLKLTNIGSTVNALRKLDGVVSEYATSLLRQWKKTVNDWFEEQYDVCKQKLYEEDENTEKESKTCKNQELESNKENNDICNKKVQMPQFKTYKGDNKNKATSEYEQRFNEIKIFTFDPIPLKVLQERSESHLEAETNEKSEIKETSNFCPLKPEVIELLEKIDEKLKETNTIKVKMSEPKSEVGSIDETQITSLQYETSLKQNCEELKTEKKSVYEDKTETNSTNQAKISEIRRKSSDVLSEKAKSHIGMPGTKTNSSEQKNITCVTKMTNVDESKTKSCEKSATRRKTIDKFKTNIEKASEINVVEEVVKKTLGKHVGEKRSIEEQKMVHFKIPKIKGSSANKEIKISPKSVPHIDHSKPEVSENATNFKLDASKKFEKNSAIKRTGKTTSIGVSTLFELCVNVFKGESDKSAPGEDQNAPPTGIANRLFLGRLLGMSKEMIVLYFMKFGHIVDYQLLVNEVGFLKGFGFIVFAKASVVNRILEAAPHFINGRLVKTQPWIPNHERLINVAVYKIFIKFLPSSVTEVDLVKAFSIFGRVVDLSFVYYKSSNLRRDIGFLTFENEHSFKRCISQGFVTVNQTMVRVSKALNHWTTSVKKAK